jgi:ribosome-binding factor A
MDNDPARRLMVAGARGVWIGITHMKDFSGRDSRRRGRRARDEAEFFESAGRGRRDHKTAQLCRQVFRAVSLGLAECGDEVLRELVVHDVEPAPDASRLLVSVGFSAAASARSVVEVLERLGEASSFLRREVAGAITRKRAPELMFTFVAGGGRGVGE